jgi:PAS domain S-box-containing protein
MTISQDIDKSKEQLIVELEELRAEVSRLSNSQHVKAELIDAEAEQHFPNNDSIDSCEHPIIPGNLRQHELALLSSQHRLEAFFSQSPDGFFFMMLDQPIQWNPTVDQNAVLNYVFSHQRVTKVNAAMLAQYGASENEFIGLTPKDFFAHDLATGKQLWREMFDQGRLHVETFERKLDETPIWIEGDYSCLYDSDGHIIGHFGIQRDISDRKQAEAELKQVSAALSHAVEGISRLDLQGRYQMVNQAYAGMVGYQPDEMIGMAWQRTVHPSDLDNMIAAYQQMLNTGKVEIEARGIRKDGSLFHKQLTMVTTYDQQQHLAGHYCFMKDISERVQYEINRKQTEAQLRQREEFLRSIYDGAEQAIFVVEVTAEAEFRYLDFNRVSERYAGVTNQSIQGKIPEEAFGTEVGSAIRQHYARCLQAATSITYEEKLDFAAQTIWTLTTLSPLQDEQGRIYRLVGTATDISDRKHKETELLYQKQELARSNDELQQFAYVASHDLQEPLRMITSYLELLERRYQGQLDARADQFIGYAVDGAKRMQTLIHDLLSYSRVGTLNRPWVLVDCEAMVTRVLTNLQVAIAESRAAITHDPLPQVNADPTQLAQVFQNLISNAIKFCGASSPQVHIGCEHTPNQWLFSVRDYGIGIESEYIDRIFLIFQRLHTRSEYPGTGIGLAICKKIVERHGGQIWVESEPSRGSTFYFTLPENVNTSL